MKSSCFGFLKDIPEVLKSNFLIEKWGNKNSPVVSKNSRSSTGEKKSFTSDGRKTGGSKNTVGSDTSSSHKSVLELYEQRIRSLRSFTVPELKSATNNFSPDLKIGEGGFGSVYRGFIKPSDGSGERILVAVKSLNKNGLQDHKEWVAEVKLLGIVDHPNVVKLIGYCAVDGEKGIQRLLVYEFMPNRSLEDHLFNMRLPALPWGKRLQVALGTAQGLAYLHEELEVQVIFRDFKASNVLLDMDFKAKLSDFGLARVGPNDGRTHVTTDESCNHYSVVFVCSCQCHEEQVKWHYLSTSKRHTKYKLHAVKVTRNVVGTAGYAAPEYIQTGHLTAKSDVWSFGVVLYELLTGRRSMDRNRPKHEQKLLEWVKEFPADSKKFLTIMDTRLENQYSIVAARRIAKLAESCLAKLSRNRPDMSRVVEILKEIMENTTNEDSKNLKVQLSEPDSVESDENLGRDVQADTGNGSPRPRLSHMARLNNENGRVFVRRRFIMMSQETQRSQHRPYLHQQRQKHELKEQKQLEQTQ